MIMYDPYVPPDMRIIKTYHGNFRIQRQRTTTTEKGNFWFKKTVTRTCWVPDARFKDRYSSLDEAINALHIRYYHDCDHITVWPGEGI